MNAQGTPDQEFANAERDLSEARTYLRTLNDLREWLGDDSFEEEVVSAELEISVLRDRLSELRRGLVDQSVVRSLDF